MQFNINCTIYYFFSYYDGAQTRNRTTDTGIFSPLLYRLSYLGINGGSDETRTRDILRDRQAL